MKRKNFVIISLYWVTVTFRKRNRNKRSLHKKKNRITYHVTLQWCIFHFKILDIFGVNKMYSDSLQKVDNFWQSYMLSDQVKFYMNLINRSAYKICTLFWLAIEIIWNIRVYSSNYCIRLVNNSRPRILFHVFAEERTWCDDVNIQNST